MHHDELSWAEENLRVIRTLVERTAIYRRAMSPIFLATGLLGAGAGLFGAYGGGFEAPARFSAYWVAVALCAIAATLALIRWQASGRGEPMWSGPARRVVRAVAPAFVSGFLLSGAIAWPATVDGARAVWLATATWLLFYGAGVSAASVFMPREMRRLGLGSSLFGALVVAALVVAGEAPPARFAHLAMGFGFGALPLGYGLYLRNRVERPASAAPAASDADVP